MSSSTELADPHTKAMTVWKYKADPVISLTSDPGGRLKTALDNFEAVLTPEQKKHLLGFAAVPDPTAVIAFTTELDNKNAERGRCCVATRLLPFLQSIHQFTTVVDTFVSFNPTVPALVWGSVKFAILVSWIFW